MKNKKNKIHEMKYYILYKYKSVLESIDDNTESIIESNNFSISVINRISIRSFTSRLKFMPYHFDVDALSNGRFNRFNGIPSSSI